MSTVVRVFRYLLFLDLFKIFIILGWSPSNRWDKSPPPFFLSCLRFDDDALDVTQILLVWINCKIIQCEVMAIEVFRAVENKKLWLSCMNAPDPPVCGLLPGFQSMNREIIEM